MRPLFDVSGTISKLGKDFSPYLAPVIAFCILTAPVAIYFLSKIIMQLLFLRRFGKILFFIAMFTLFTGVHYVDKMYKFHNGGYVDVATRERGSVYKERVLLKSRFAEYEVTKKPIKLFPYIKRDKY